MLDHTFRTQTTFSTFHGCLLLELPLTLSSHLDIVMPLYVHVPLGVILFLYMPLGMLKLDF